MRQTPVWPVTSRSSGPRRRGGDLSPKRRKTGAPMRSYSNERPIGHAIVQEIFHWLALLGVKSCE